MMSTFTSFLSKHIVNEIVLGLAQHYSVGTVFKPSLLTCICTATYINNYTLVLVQWSLTKENHFSQHGSRRELEWQEKESSNTHLNEVDSREVRLNE